MSHRLGALKQSTRSFLVSRALKIAQKKHGQLPESPLKQARVLPVSGIAELSDVIKFVTIFHREKTPPDNTLKTLASLMSVSLCSAPGPLSRERRVTPKDGRMVGGRMTALNKSGLTVVDLIELASMSKQSGDKLSKEAYSELLKLCLSLINSGSEQGTKTHIVMEMVDHMIQDWGKEEVRSTAYSSAFQASTNSTQVDSLYRHFKRTGIQPKLDKKVVVEAYLDTEAVPRPSLSRLISEDPDGLPSGLTFERLILGCVEANQLQRCIGLYTCMTRRYRITPSRMVFSSVTRMLVQTLGTKPPHQWRLALCSQLLTNTLCVFDGQPPLWVYPEMAKPLTLLLGNNGYKEMVEASGRAAQEYCSRHKEIHLADVLRDLWDPVLFYSLLQCAHKTGNTTLALDLLTDIKALYGTLSKPLDWIRVFEKMLSLVKSRKDLIDYLPTLVEEMTTILNKKQINALQDPLFRALTRAYHHNCGALSVDPQKRVNSHPPAPGYLFKASQFLISTAVQSTSMDQCIRDLARCADKYVEIERTTYTDYEDLGTALAI